MSLRLLVLSVGISAVQSAAIRSHGMTPSLHTGHPSLQEHVSKSVPTATIHYMVAANAMTEISNSKTHIHRLMALVAHSENASNYKDLYEQKEEDLEAQKELCAKCEKAEESLIKTLKQANAAHTTAQGALEDLDEAKKAVDEAEEKVATTSDEWNAMKDEITKALDALQITSPNTDYEEIKTKTDQLLALAKNVVAAKAEAVAAGQTAKDADEAYKNAKGEAEDADDATTEKMTARDAACAGIKIPAVPEDSSEEEGGETQGDEKVPSFPEKITSFGQVLSQNDACNTKRSGASWEQGGKTYFKYINAGKMKWKDCLKKAASYGGTLCSDDYTRKEGWGGHRVGNTAEAFYKFYSPRFANINTAEELCIFGIIEQMWGKSFEVETLTERKTDADGDEWAYADLGEMYFNECALAASKAGASIIDPSTIGTGDGNGYWMFTRHSGNVYLYWTGAKTTGMFNVGCKSRGGQKQCMIGRLTGIAPA